MSLKFFVTGTDTGIGKTYISVALLKLFHAQGYSTIGYKPIAAGASKQGNQLYNQDALDLNAASSIKLAYHHTNPFVFEPPISPDIAAAQAGTPLTLTDIVDKSQYVLQQPCDLVLTEGAGGWLQPLNRRETLQDLAVHFQMKVVLVVGIRLGCINHTLLTYQAIKQANLTVVGWVANCFEINELEPNTVIEDLKSWLPNIPYLGMVPYQQAAERFLNVGHLLQERSIA